MRVSYFMFRSIRPIPPSAVGKFSVLLARMDLAR